jgi:hypothetical protein
MHVNEFFRCMQAKQHSFEVTRDPWTLYICESGYGSLSYDGSHNWEILQGRYTLCFLFEYAATLGIIDVAYIPPYGARPNYGDLWGTDDLEFLSRYDGLLYLGLNTLGAYCLGVSHNYKPSPVECRSVLKIMSNLELAALAPLTAGDRLMLDVANCKHKRFKLQTCPLLAILTFLLDPVVPKVLLDLRLSSCVKPLLPFVESN